MKTIIFFFSQDFSSQEEIHFIPPRSAASQISTVSMITEQLKEEIKKQEPIFLEVANTRGYICPQCGNGSGSSGTGLEKDPRSDHHFKCFKCDFYGDVIDLFGIHSDIEDFASKIDGLIEFYYDHGVEIVKNQTMNDCQSCDSLPMATSAVKEPMRSSGVTKPKQEETDQTSFFKECSHHLSSPACVQYLSQRGISVETARRFHLGYCVGWRHPKSPKSVPESPRLIIPTSDCSYIARDIRSDREIPEEAKPYTKSKVGSVHIFNGDILKTSTKPVFIVEGEIDALSIEEVGGNAVALGGVSNTRQLIELLQQSPPTFPVILSLDNDTAGNEASDKLLSELKSLSISAVKLNICGNHKDANEALIHSRNLFEKNVREAEGLALSQVEAERNAERDNYLETSVAHFIPDFLQHISESVNSSAIPTGFCALDKILDGGLYEGLYVLGAISSLGKTTLVLQIADQIAESGQDVLIFSLEMSRTELMSKSISRHTFMECKLPGGDLQDAKTNRGITDGKRYEKYSEKEREVIQKAVTAYRQYATHIYIHEGQGDIGVKQIRETLETHIRLTGNVPVVVIDYLQILAPWNDRFTDKQNTDRAVLELKRMSRDFKLPVIAISSFNRENYNTPVTMTAFKESGAIEYSSDVLIGLQLGGIWTREGKIDKNVDVHVAKNKDPRDIELVVLKNRNGKAGNAVAFSYRPRFNHFEDNPVGCR